MPSKAKRAQIGEKNKKLKKSTKKGSKSESKRGSKRGSRKVSMKDSKRKSKKGSRKVQNGGGGGKCNGKHTILGLLKLISCKCDRSYNEAKSSVCGNNKCDNPICNWQMTDRYGNVHKCGHPISQHK